MLVVSLGKSARQKLKILDGEKLEYCKPVGEPQKRVGEPKCEISVKEAKRGDMIFDLNLVGEKSRRTLWLRQGIQDWAK